MKRSKRLFDLLVSGSGLLALSPVFLAVAVIVKLSDRGPVFFTQERVGYRGVPFRIYKFRTMVSHAEKMGAHLTPGNDCRVTGVGRVLRKLKLDEIPQLINVLKGEMSLVGPRPEVPGYAALYDSGQKKVLELVPGITDPASIKYRNESDILALYPDPEKTYIEEIMPDKIKINLSYSKKANLFSDFMVIVNTIFRVLVFNSPKIGLPE